MRAGSVLGALVALVLAGVGAASCIGFEKGSCLEADDCETPNSCQFVVCDRPANAAADERGTCRLFAKPIYSPCEFDSALVCDGDEHCVSTCSNGIKDGFETDVDCGGGCPECAEGAGCGQGADCESGICAGLSHVCAPAGCDDGILNLDETDCDGDGCQVAVQGGVKACVGAGCTRECGGVCGRCSALKKCAADTDCATGSCNGGVCCVVPCPGVCHVCDAETGACSLAPAGTNPGERCPAVNGAGDINVCDGAGACILCTSGVKDAVNGETDVDCGGAVCARCADGKACQVDADCVSCRCDVAQGSAAGKCVSSVELCGDFEIDGCETDANCGGPHCPKCGFGASCRDKSDCLSGSCVEDQCAEP